MGKILTAMIETNMELKKLKQVDLCFVVLLAPALMLFAWCFLLLLV